jgi:hypothetical protein
MTTQVVAALPIRTVRAALLAGLAGLVAPGLAALLLFIALSALGFRFGARR